MQHSRVPCAPRHRQMPCCGVPDRLISGYGVFGVGGDRLATTGPHLTQYKESEQGRRAQIWKHIPNSSREQCKVVMMFLQLGSRGVLTSTEETTKAH